MLLPGFIRLLLLLVALCLCFDDKICCLILWLLDLSDLFYISMH
jgi:hypothetical protein